MNTNEAMALEQQRQRRNRINRMKTGIILTIVGWMIISFLAIVILSVQVVRLDHKMDRLVANNTNTTAGVAGMNTGSKNAAQKEADSQSPYGDVVTGIDSPDNIAEDGDTHKVYLTLDVRDEDDVKTTFFVVGNESDEMKDVYKRNVAEGHTLGMNSYSNQYSTIYASSEAFEEDFDKLSMYLEKVTGEKSVYYRFPGGSGNEISNVNMAELVHVLNKKKITYFDWNVSAGDAASDYSVDDIVTNVTTGVSHYKTSVVLLHDGENKSTTVEALGPLIEALQKMDAEILPIDENTKVIQYIKADSVE